MLSWNVFRENTNTDEIEVYDIFKGGHLEKVAKEIKSSTDTKTEFSKYFRMKLVSQFWCRSEYEVVITSWPPYISKDELNKLNIEQANFYERYKTYPYRQTITPTVTKKVDIFKQIDLNWEHFINYVWNNI